MSVRAKCSEIASDFLTLFGRDDRRPIRADRRRLGLRSAIGRARLQLSSCVLAIVYAYIVYTTLRRRVLCGGCGCSARLSALWSSRLRARRPAATSQVRATARRQRRSRREHSAAARDPRFDSRASIADREGPGVIDSRRVRERRRESPRSRGSSDLDDDAYVHRRPHRCRRRRSHRLPDRSERRRIRPRTALVSNARVLRRLQPTVPLSRATNGLLRNTSAAQDSYDGGFGYVFIVASWRPMRFDRFRRTARTGTRSSSRATNYLNDPRPAIHELASLLAGDERRSLHGEVRALLSTRRRLYAGYGGVGGGSVRRVRLLRWISSRLGFASPFGSAGFGLVRARSIGTDTTFYVPRHDVLLRPGRRLLSHVEPVRRLSATASVDIRSPGFRRLLRAARAASHPDGHRTPLTPKVTAGTRSPRAGKPTPGGRASRARHSVADVSRSAD